MRRIATTLAVCAMCFVAGLLARPIAGSAWRAIHQQPRTLSARHLDFIEQMKHVGKQADVIFIGDSITDFWRCSPDLWRQYFGDDAINLGIGGEATDDVLMRIQAGELSSEFTHPKAIVLLVGTNDLAYGESPEHVAANVATISKVIRSSQPQAHLILLGVFPRDPSVTLATTEKIAETNKLLSNIGGVDYRDIGNIFLNDDGSICREAVPDGVHPNYEGYRRWGEAMREILK